MNIYPIRSKWSKQEPEWSNLLMQYQQMHFNAYNAYQKVSSLIRDLYVVRNSLDAYIDLDDNVPNNVRAEYGLPNDGTLPANVTHLLNTDRAKELGTIAWPIKPIRDRLDNMKGDYALVQEQLSRTEHDRKWGTIVDTTMRILNDVRWVELELAKIPTKKEAYRLLDTK